MDFGLSLDPADVAGAMASFFAISAVVGILGSVLALGFVPRLSRALLRLIDRE